VRASTHTEQAGTSAAQTRERQPPSRHQYHSERPHVRSSNTTLIYKEVSVFDLILLGVLEAISLGFSLISAYLHERETLYMGLMASTFFPLVFLLAPASALHTILPFQLRLVLVILCILAMYLTIVLYVWRHPDRPNRVK
jgi:hypothetical protein